MNTRKLGVLGLSMGLLACGSANSGEATDGTAGSEGSAGTDGPGGSEGSEGPEGPTSSAGSEGSGDSDGPEPLPPDDCQGEGVDNSTPFSDTYRVIHLADTTFEGKPYPIVTAMPWTYTLSAVQCGKDFPVEETETHYIVDSDFEVPYLKGVTDEVAWMPGAKNKGWAIGENDDPAEKIAENGGMRPFVYHVNAGYEYGYSTYNQDPLPDDPINFTGFRPTWVVHPEGDSYKMFFLIPEAPDSQGFEWPRHGQGWQLNFGLYVDPEGRVYVPKPERATVANHDDGWDDYHACVTINLGSAPVPTTRTQFPGNESYYPSETFLPGYASAGAPGHKYWGHKGRPMEEVAIWEDDGAPGLNSPGNFHKPYSGGCDRAGYNFAHAEGFTWPELRAARTEMGDIPTREQLYKITLYRYLGQEDKTELLGTLSYEQQANQEWIPTGEGPEVHSLNDKNGRFIVNGPVFQDRGDHVFAIIEDI
ncbi:hypothetical protein OV203_19715 [Nannocystis sp. ILAH1]|nr:hypothetical protein [Nannocystis sp. ILAH1]MCY0989377.1 hypothetical protein [Nannocystis sp. ILAH1]